jgi:methylmalonyl-CoA mutase
MNSNPWSDFDAHLPDRWKEAAQQELNGEDPFVKLKIAKGKISILPYYDSCPANTSSFFSLPISANTYLGARGWVNAPKILVADEKSANKLALDHLNRGADGILFQIDTNPKFDQLLKGIELPYCFTFFQGGINLDFRTSLFHYLQASYQGQPTPGGLFSNRWISLSDTVDASFKQVGFVVAEKETTEDTIAWALKNLVDLLDQCTDQGESAEKILRQVAFSVSIGTDFFQEAVKLKVLRGLFSSIALAYGVADVHVHIHATSTRWIKDAFQPHGNLIKSTTAGLAAVLGGCDSLTIEAEETENGTLQRMARNVSSLLREESHLSRVADPLEGSYYVESLADAVAEKSWAYFKELVKS